MSISSDIVKEPGQILKAGLALCDIWGLVVAGSFLLVTNDDSGVRI